MRIRLADRELDNEYLRYARRETMKALHVEPDPSMFSIPPFAKYLLAEDSSSGNPMGLCEAAMLSFVYDSYDDTPYRDTCDLNAFCPLSEMAGVRTIFVEPQYRKSSALFTSLTLAAVKLFYGFGARFATASTRSADEYLDRLYTKWGGERVGEFTVAAAGEPSSLFVFDLTRMLNHRAMRRLSREVTFDFGEAMASS